MTRPDELVRLPVPQLQSALASGELTAVALATAFLDRIEAVDPQIGAFLFVDRDGALAQASDIDARRAAGQELGPLAGIPIAIKDVLVQQGVPTTAGSRLLEGWVSPYDADVVERLKAADLVILGKTNMDEFAMGGSTEFSGYHPTRNPWDLQRVPGGSGGGSAAALAAYLTPLAIGSDTGGSIRQPAAFTGTVGAKPSYGSVSRYGAIALASSLDQLGPAARTVGDTALLHEVIAGFDGRDNTSVPGARADVLAGIAAGVDISGMRIGIITELDPASASGFAAGVQENFAQAVALLQQVGAQVEQVSLPSLPHALAAYYLIMPSEASSNLARFDGIRYGKQADCGPDASAAEVTAASRGEGFGPEVIRRILLGTYALSAGYYDQYYGKAQQVRTLIAQDFAAAFEQFDVLISPTTATAAFALGERVDDPEALYATDIATCPVNLAGLPALSVPMGLNEQHLPVGLQIIAPAQADDRMYRVGVAFEKALNLSRGGAILEEVPTL